MIARRKTKSLRLVLNAVDQLKHPSALEIHSWINQNKSDQKIGLTSVYRALRILTDWGDLRPLPFLKNEVRYEMSNNENYYFICVTCESLLMLENTSIIVQMKEKGSFPEFSLALFGQCFKCKI